MKLDFTLPVDDNIDCRRRKSKPGYRILLADFHFYGQTIPKDFEWDGASSPLLARPIVPKFDHSLISSCAHDFLCRHAKNAEGRKVADLVYKKLLIEVEGFSKARAELAYRGVRIGAWWGTGVRYPHWIKDNVWPVFGVKAAA